MVGPPCVHIDNMVKVSTVLVVWTQNCEIRSWESFYHGFRLIPIEGYIEELQEEGLGYRVQIRGGVLP